jgi:hypothetical protein
VVWNYIPKVSPHSNLLTAPKVIFPKYKFHSDYSLQGIIKPNSRLLFFFFLSKQTKKYAWAGGVAHTVEHLPSKGKP